MTSAANELLQAIHTRLAADEALTAVVGSTGIRDRLVTGTQLPAVVFADLVTNDYSTATDAGEEHLLTLQVWSDAEGRRQAQEIAGMVRDLLDDADLPLAGHALVNLQHVSTRSRRETKTRFFATEIHFRAVTE